MPRASKETSETDELGSKIVRFVMKKLFAIKMSMSEVMLRLSKDGQVGTHETRLSNKKFSNYCIRREIINSSLRFLQVIGLYFNKYYCFCL